MSKVEKFIKGDQKEENEGILITDQNGVVLNINQEFTRITGYTSQDIIGKNPRILKSGKHSKAFYKNMWGAIKSVGYWHGNIWNKRKNGELYTECLTINRIDSNNNTYFVATLKDTKNCDVIDSCSIKTNQQTHTREQNYFTEEDLLKAIENNELIIHYQPLLNVVHQKIYGIEALLRWKHPKLGTIAPMEFIPLAEKTGLIVPITEWLIEKASNDLKVLHGKGFKALKILINISVEHFQRANFSSLIKSTLDKTKLEPSFMELEITENIFLKPTEEILTKMNELKKLGIRLSIDDFGTGYSSLQYLKYFPFDSIKIDKAFIQDIESNNVNRLIVEAIIKLGKGLNLNIIAEGVENNMQLDFLSQLECDTIQGYLFSKPVILNHLMIFLSSKGQINYA